MGNLIRPTMNDAINSQTLELVWQIYMGYNETMIAPG